jgi:hypothetical protein
VGVSAAETAAGGVHGFPAELTSFVGRDEQVREVAGDVSVVRIPRTSHWVAVENPAGFVRALGGSPFELDPETLKSQLLFEVANLLPLADIEWNRFPVKAMAKLGWIPNVKKLELRAEVNLARVLQVHPAIVAGKIRHEEEDYRLLSHFVGTGEVRRHFATLVARDTRRDATSAE